MEFPAKVMARWTSKDNDMSRKTLELECNISKEEEEDKGYCSDKGYNLLSKTWSREEREKRRGTKAWMWIELIKQTGEMATTKKR